MMLDAMKTVLLDALFTQGRVWTESVTDISSDIAAEYDATATDALRYSRFATQVMREFSAVSGALREVAGAYAVPESYVRDVGNTLFAGRYSGRVPFSDWRLWHDRVLRSSLSDEFRQAFLAGKNAADAAEGMVDILTSQPVLPDESFDVPSAFLPTSLADGDSLIAPASTIGNFGPVAFEVGHREIFTLSELSRRRDAGFAEHAVINGRKLLQFTGIGLWEVTLKVQLFRNWTDPEKRIAQFSAMQESGDHHPLVIGGRNFGRFVMTSYAEAVKRFGRSGEIEFAELDLGLREYSDSGRSSVRVSRVRTGTPAVLRPTSTVKRLTTSHFRGR